MSTGFVYKLINSVDKMVYIGSTRRSIATRFKKHKSNAKDVFTRTSRLYQHMRKIGVKYFDVVLIAEVKGKENDALLKAEFREMEKYVDAEVKLARALKEVRSFGCKRKARKVTILMPLCFDGSRVMSKASRASIKRTSLSKNTVLH